MIVFDGISINSVAGIDIDDIHVSPIQYDMVTTPRAIRGGSDFVRSRAGTRTITITFALLDDNMVNRQKALLALSEWAKNDKEYKLELPGHPEHYLMAVCTEKPSPSLRQWWENGLRLVFTCYDNPYWNAKSKKSVACGTDFFVLGDAPPLMQIKLSTQTQLTNQSYGLDGNTITFSTIPAGYMIIDLNDQLAWSLNGSTRTDLMQYYNVNSRFLIPRTGAMKITGTGMIEYWERWQ